MKKIVRLGESDKNLLGLELIEGVYKASITVDGGENWTDIDYDSNIVQNNLDKFDNSLEKEQFFNNHIGNKIRIENGNFGIEGFTSGWLVIKSLDNITIRLDRSDKFISVAYEEIGFDILADNNIKFTFNLTRIDELPEEKKVAYEEQMRKEIQENKSITPKKIDTF